MLEQGQRHDQWHDAVQVLANQLLDFLLVLRADGLLEVATDMLQHVGVGAAGGAFFQGFHQLAEVVRGNGSRVLLAEVAEQSAEGFVLHRVMGHQLVFVASMELGQ